MTMSVIITMTISMSIFISKLSVLASLSLWLSLWFASLRVSEYHIYWYHHMFISLSQSLRLWY